MTRVYRPKISRSENGDQFSQDTSPIPHPSHQSPESILAEAIMSLNSPESPQVSHSHHQNVSDSHVQLAPPYIPTDDPTNSLEQLAIDILGVLSRLPEGEKRTKHHLVTLLTQSLPITTLSTLAARIDPSLKYWYPCTHPGCFNVYSKAHNLKRHLYSHNGLRPYKCTVPGCDKSYTSADRLGTHINTHTEIRPHKCRFCEKSFVHPKSRRNHELLHGEPTYICTHVGCEKRFHRPDKLREHMKVHNRQELEDSAPLNTPLEQPSQDRRHSTLSSGSSSSLSITPKDIMALSDRSQHSDSSYMLLPRLHNHPSYVSHNTSTSTSPFSFPEHPPESTSASSSLPSSPRLEPHDSEIPDSHSHNYPQPFSTSQSDSNSPIPFYFPPQMPLPQNMPIMPLMNNNMQLNMNMFDMNNLMQMGFLEMNMNMSMIANATAAAAENNFGRDSPDNESPNDTQERRRKRKQSKT